VPLKVRLTAFTDRSFKFIVKPPETSWFLHRAASLDKFTMFPGHYGIVPIPIQYVYEIAKIKKEMDPDMAKADVAKIMTVGLKGFR
jgi:large subunit ribosomal protein L11